jgi:hypothetical protein
MSPTIHDIDFRTKLPDVAGTLPVARVAAPSASERIESARTLADVLGLGNTAHVDLPFGHALASKTGQVEVFAASGAVRARSIERLTAYDDERRPWRDARRRDDDGSWELDTETSRVLAGEASGLLEKARLLTEPASIDVVLAQWAELDEKGNQVDSGPGRATVRFGYESAGLPFIGPGAKSLVHYDPVDGGVALARMFHVHRRTEKVIEVAGTDPERLFARLLAEPIFALDNQPDAKIAITAAEFGLLALPADVPQRAALPSLALEGVIEGLSDAQGRAYELRFARYITVPEPEALSKAGLASAPFLTSSTPVRARGEAA